MFVENKIIF